MMAKKKAAAKPKRPALQTYCILCGGLSGKNHLVFCPGVPTPEIPPAPKVQVSDQRETKREPYTNPGKGLVLTNDSITGRVAALFDANPFRESRELNELVGWQFSQAVYALRRRGWRIQTLRLGPRRFAYQRLSIQEGQPL